MNSELIEFLKNLDEWPTSKAVIYVLGDSDCNLKSPTGYEWALNSCEEVCLVSVSGKEAIFKDDWQNAESFKPQAQSIRIGNTVIRKDRIESYEIKQDRITTEYLDQHLDTNISTETLDTVSVHVYSFSGREFIVKSQKPDCELIAQLDEILGV